MSWKSKQPLLVFSISLSRVEFLSLKSNACKIYDSNFDYQWQSSLVIFLFLRARIRVVSKRTMYSLNSKKTIMIIPVIIVFMVVIEVNDDIFDDLPFCSVKRGWERQEILFSRNRSSQRNSPQMHRWWSHVSLKASREKNQQLLSKTLLWWTKVHWEEGYMKKKGDSSTERHEIVMRRDGRETRKHNKIRSDSDGKPSES
jgi:hypothetical protein